ncbi:MAG TPA: NapC/NirT family cytochrome c [Polyangiaceae bacterium]|nr:NapC/NirT family cytochrome c [Polyangiaceae bacterium]
MEHPVTWLGYVCVAAAVLAILIIGWYLRKQPRLDFTTKLVLLVGLGVLPAISAGSSTVTGMEATTKRHFCGSCHVMDPYVNDAGNPESQSLAARHGRNPFFGDRNCYVCHADYGMYGYPMTKLAGMNHVYQYYVRGWRNYTIEEALAKLHISKPYDNLNCRQCHSGTLADWGTVPEHVALEKELASNAVSCASSGCHGYAHPFSKKDGAEGLPQSALGSDKPDRAVPSALPSAARDRIAEEKRKEAERRAADEAAREAAKEAAREAAKKAAKERGTKKEQTP